MENHQTFGELLKIYIREAGYNQSNLAEKIEIDRSTISRWVNDVAQPNDLGQVLKIADFLKLKDGKRERLIRAFGYSPSALYLSESKEDVKKEVSSNRDNPQPAVNDSSEPKSLPPPVSLPDLSVFEMYAKETLARTRSLDIGQNHLSTEMVEIRRVTKRLLALKSVTIDAVDLEAANHKLDELPLDSIPNIAALPIGSYMPFSANPLFVGRESELKAIAIALKGGETVAIGQIAAATGLGGIGKTQLAVEFVHRYGQFFSGGVHWLSFTDPNGIATKIAECGVTMPDLRADFDTFDFEDQVQLVLSAWQSPLPRLLIFDNCEEPLLLEQWRPKTGGSRVLVTSRRQQWDATLNVQSLVLETLTRDQSVELLRKFRPDLAEIDSELEQIAAELGDLPLALHLAGSYLARYRYEIKPEQYLAQLRQPALLQHSSLQQGGLSPTHHEQHIKRTFDLSYERLNPQDPVDTLALSLLARAACFASDQLIPRTLLLATVELNDAGTLQAADGLQQLSNLGLLEIETAGNLRMHLLVAYFVQQADAGVLQKAQRDVESAIREEAFRINMIGDPSPLRKWQIHLRYVTDRSLLSIKEAIDTNFNAFFLCRILGNHLHKIKEYEAAKHYYEHGLLVVEECFGKKSFFITPFLYDLGRLLRDMHNFDAAKSHYERALSICLETFGNEHTVTAFSLNDSGALLHSIGEIDAAKSSYDRALNIYRVLLHRNPPNIKRVVLDASNGLINYGALLQSMGDLEAAKSHLEQVLSMCLKVFGERHYRTADCLSVLGDLLKNMGDLVTAKSYLEQALTIRQEILTEKHSDIVTSLIRLGHVLLNMGEMQAAKPYFEQALVIQQEVLGEKHISTAHLLRSFGVLLMDMGDFDAAKHCYEQILTILETRDLPRSDIEDARNHLAWLPTTPNTLFYIKRGNAYHTQGKYDLAIAIYSRAIKLEPNSPLAYNQRGTSYYSQGKYDLAAADYNKAIELEKNGAVFYSNLGNSFHAQGNYEQALTNYCQAITIDDRLLITSTYKLSDQVREVVKQSIKKLKANLE